MTTTATKTTTSKKVAKPRANAKGKLDNANKTVTTQKVIVHRELKYQYPRTCKDTLARKAFRQTVRNAIRKMERNITDLKGEEKNALKSDLAAYKAENLA